MRSGCYRDRHGSERDRERERETEFRERDRHRDHVLQTREKDRVWERERDSEVRARDRNRDYEPQASERDRVRDRDRTLEDRSRDRDQIHGREFEIRKRDQDRDRDRDRERERTDHDRVERGRRNRREERSDEWVVCSDKERDGDRYHRDSNHRRVAVNSRRSGGDCRVPQPDERRDGVDRGNTIGGRSRVESTFFETPLCGYGPGGGREVDDAGLDWHSDKPQTEPGKKQIDRFLQEIKTKHIAASDLPSAHRIYVERPPRRLRRVIDVLAKYVARYGAHFEEAVRKDLGKRRREIVEKLGVDDGDLDFGFLVEDAETPEAHYYRWRSFSYAQGDRTRHWRTEAFQMCSEGIVWHPPTIDHGESSHSRSRSRSCSHSRPLCKSKSRARDRRCFDWRPFQRGNVPPGTEHLGRSDRKDLARLLRNSSTRAVDISDAMIWCLDNADCSVEISKSLVDGLVEEGLALQARLSRLLLISDVAHNSGSAIANAAWCYRREFEAQLPVAFERLRIAYRAECSHLAAQRVAEQVYSVLQSWQNRAIFTAQYVKGLEAAFFRDVLSADAVAPPGGGRPRSGVVGLPDTVCVKLAEWRSLHFSQLEKIAKARGLNWQTQQIVQHPADVRPLEQTKKSWLIDRLTTYEVYAWQTRPSVSQAARPEVIEDLPSLVATRPASGGHDVLTNDRPSPDSDLDGNPLADDDIDGDSLSSGDEMSKASCAANEDDIDGIPMEVPATIAVSTTADAMPVPSPPPMPAGKVSDEEDDDDDLDGVPINPKDLHKYVLSSSLPRCMSTGSIIITA